MTEQEVRDMYHRLTRMLIRRKMTITSMESCTSGQIASLITDTEGASAVLKGAFITYSNEAKIRMGVPAEIIGQYGVYSAETAAAMAETARRFYDADWSFGVTGSTGNVDPGNADSVPGQVWFAVAGTSGTEVTYMEIPPLETRLEYKLTVAGAAAEKLIEKLQEQQEDSDRQTVCHPADGIR